VGKADQDNNTLSNVVFFHSSLVPTPASPDGFFLGRHPCSKDSHNIANAVTDAEM
jgi:hypothetical protein